MDCKLMGRPSSMHPAFAGFREVFSDTPMTVEAVYVDQVPHVAQRPIPVPRVAPEEKRIPTCSILIGVSVILLLMWIWRNYSIQDAPPCRGRGVRMVSTMKTTTPSQPTKAVDHFVKVDQTTQENTKNMTNLTECSDEKCQNYRSLTPADKAKFKSPIDDFLKKHPKMMIMIYAPWCPHCTKSMGTFYDAASDAPCPFGLINAELAHPDHISGEERVCDVKYFPTFVVVENTERGKKVTHMTSPPTKEAMLKMLETEDDGLEQYF